MSGWQVLYRKQMGHEFPMRLTVWLDNLGGIMLGMDEGDGEKVIIVPISQDMVDDLTEALNAKSDRPTPDFHAEWS